MSLRLKFLLSCLLLLVGAPAHAILDIEITQGIEGALPIAIVPFTWNGPDEEPPEAIGAIVAADLHRSGQFTAFPQTEFPQRPASASEIESIFDQVLALANNKLEGRSMFGGWRTQITPFQSAGRGVEYLGNDGELKY